MISCYSTRQRVIGSRDMLLCATLDSRLTLYGRIQTAQQRTVIQQYGDWFTGR